ncbi:rhodanese-like domain-containing protein 8, chloroplastic isoform X2 [Phalaenopsis equestris]|uniref:rhodanese-like domain-containing protein 8, chloroplastic isoform X2 n=1 Tax=Phalaenopsis equestris TaxID=78828 RepID=UPI0009E3578D|nr:rhodanese-like domain-containing protein 8, chloroplastic isoform X2 [Phalaenopsis equestris]
MAISCCVTSPLPRCSPVPSLPWRIPNFSARISVETSFSKKSNRSTVHCSVMGRLVFDSSSSSFRKGEGGGNGDAEFCVVTFYKFVLIEDPEGEVAKHQEFLQGHDINGRIYVNEQGINAQYSGPVDDALAYADWLKEDLRFSDILVQTSPALDGHAFPRLKLRYKPSLVQLEGGMSHLPVLDPTMRAALLTPAEWRERLQASTNKLEKPNKARGSNHDRRPILLDVRNGYEWDVGHFQGAERPEVDSFRHTSVGLSSDEAVPATKKFKLNCIVPHLEEKLDDMFTGVVATGAHAFSLNEQGFASLAQDMETEHIGDSGEGLNQI